jgi:hypothetical protein
MLAQKTETVSGESDSCRRLENNPVKPARQRTFVAHALVSNPAATKPLGNEAGCESNLNRSIQRYFSSEIIIIRENTHCFSLGFYPSKLVSSDTFSLSNLSDHPYQKNHYLSIPIK